MAKKILTHSFPYIVSFYVLMLVAYFIGAANIILPIFIKGWDFVPSTSIPYDLVGWFWMALASVYVGGTALLNFFTSRNLNDLESVDVSHEKLHRVVIMNYAACFYCFVIKVLGVDIPLEAIVSAAGSCAVLIVLGKKASETAVQAEMHDRDDEDDEIRRLALKLDLRKASGEFVDRNNTGKDDVIEELERRIEDRKKELGRPVRNGHPPQPTGKGLLSSASKMKNYNF